MPTIMAGLDNVDPAYACQLPVSFAVPPVEHTTIPPNSPMPKQHPRADWIGDFPDREVLVLQAGVASEPHVLVRWI